MKVLIVDDDRTLSELLAFTVRRAGFEPYVAFNAVQAMAAFEKFEVDIVLLDVNMPGEPGLRDGFDVCQKIREISHVPIILLTVRDEEDDVVKGLTIGADDYITKPFSPRQLIARIKSILRRTGSARIDRNEPYTFKDYTYDPGLRTFTKEGRDPISLTRLESRLLDILIINRGQIIPADNLISHVWGVNGGSSDMLRQLIHRLRQKIDSGSDPSSLIQNAPGIGYGIDK